MPDAIKAKTDDYQVNLYLPALGERSGVAQIQTTLRVKQFEESSRQGQERSELVLSPVLRRIEGSTLRVRGFLTLDLQVLRGEGWNAAPFGLTRLVWDDVFRQYGDFPSWSLGEWVWRLATHELLEIERTNDRSDVFLTVKIDGLAAVSELDHATNKYGPLHLARLSWSAPLRIAASDWAEVTGTVPLFPQVTPFPLRTALRHKSWEKAAQLLRDARAKLEGGDAREAMRSCYDALVKVVEQKSQDGSARIYEQGFWEKLLRSLGEERDPSIPESLRDRYKDRFTALATLFWALGQAANVFGRHAGQLSQHLDHWEGEILIAMEYLAAAYLTRVIDEAAPAKEDEAKRMGG